MAERDRVDNRMNGREDCRMGADSSLEESSCLAEERKRSGAGRQYGIGAPRESERHLRMFRCLTKRSREVVS